MSDLESLTAAMALVPLLYSRNRMFALFADPTVRRARNRARTVRSLLRFIARDDARVEVSVSGERVRIAYRIARLRLSRVVQLSDFELSLLRVLLAKGKHPSELREDPNDRQRIDVALARLPKEVSSVA